MIKTQEDFFTNIYLSLYCKGSKRVTQGLRVRGSWRPNKNCNILTPHLWPSRCVFLVLLMLNRRPWGPLCWLLPFFTASYQQLLWSPNSIGVPEGPLGRVWLSLPHLVYNSSPALLQLPLYWQLIRAPSPFGLVWLSLPHFVSNWQELELNCVI